MRRTTEEFGMMRHCPFMIYEQIYEPLAKGGLMGESHHPIVPYQ